MARAIATVLHAPLVLAVALISSYFLAQRFN